MTLISESQQLARARTFEVASSDTYALFFQISGSQLIPMVEELETGYVQYPLWDPTTLTFVDFFWDENRVPHPEDRASISAAWAAFLSMPGKLTIKEILT